MAELEGQLSFFDGVKAELENPSGTRAFAILDLAEANGWVLNPFASFTIRLTREDGLPFFATWHVSFNAETGKRSYRFASARASNAQPLNFNDIKIYLTDPSVIFPEPPTSPEDDTDEAFRTALGSLDPLGPTASPLRPSSIPALDWGALL